MSTTARKANRRTSSPTLKAHPMRRLEDLEDYWRGRNPDLTFRHYAENLRSIRDMPVRFWTGEMRQSFRELEAAVRDLAPDNRA